ncbi:alpha/beta-hydrolase [Lentithecium fluviatile CBS 122367]|uniref:Alpha/beta-hydrolase n=1 Tax=Lentithecium fluviatile CBS 122367 TaxID=1168545 RepID=A0A6G1IFG7_9PLEO|nr:alpha/beta-hydrolase [Lentithecium fluviatile CBS 122367]
MIQPVFRATTRSRPLFPRACISIYNQRAFSGTRWRKEDPRLHDLGRVIEDEYAVLRDKYETPKHTLILAHGLLGFDELRLAGRFLPGIQYWRGITDALSRKGIEVIVAAVPPSGSIEARAQQLADSIAEKAGGKDVNIIAHTCSGLDARYMISRLQPSNVKVLSLTTIATPHRGSAFADYMFDTIGTHQIKRLYKVMEYFGLETGAFSQLTRRYMQTEFNDKTPNIDGIRYFSYGASLEPSRWSIFAMSHAIIKEMEGGVNDGLVSVSSSRWGEYKGTLIGVSHLDLINWTNRLKWFFWELTGSKRNFNAIAFYLDIADMLAKEGL